MRSVLKLLERLPVPVVIANPLTARILWVNHNLVKMGRGSHPDEFVGKSIMDFIKPEQMSKALTDLAAVVAGKSPDPVIYGLKKLDGELAAVHVASIPMVFRGQPAMLSLVTDVSERERLIRDLAESEERYRLLLANTPGGIMVTLDREVVFANESIAHALSLRSAAALIGRDMYEFVAPEDHAAVREHRHRAMSTGVPTAPMAVTLMAADGTRFRTKAGTARISWGGLPAAQTLMHDLPNPTVASDASDTDG